MHDAPRGVFGGVLRWRALTVNDTQDHRRDCLGEMALKAEIRFPARQPASEKSSLLQKAVSGKAGESCTAEYSLNVNVCIP